MASKNTQQIDITSEENRDMVRKIDRFANRINGKVTVATLKNMFLVLPEESRPSAELLKAYVKSN